jgi:3D (Asp-Asp-Asp) domain-containing protein
MTYLKRGVVAVLVALGLLSTAHGGIVQHTNSKQQPPNHAATKDNKVLARITYYRACEDHYSSQGLTSTGESLKTGVCAVDPHLIPFHSDVHIEGFGTYKALDSGSAVVSRKAAREAARTKAEHNALVVDIYCRNAHEQASMEASHPLFAYISWD